MIFDNATWTTRMEYIYQGEIPIRFRPENVQVGNGLKLTLDLDDNALYSAGEVNTINKWSFRFGYAECRAKLPRGQGLISSFFAVEDGGRNEIDVFENLGRDDEITQLWATVHQIPPEKKSSLHLETRIDLSLDFHRYGILWEPEYLAWYFDGQRIFYNADLVPQKAMHLYLMVCCGGWSGAPDATTPLPSAMDVDYVRVWQRQ